MDHMRAITANTDSGRLTLFKDSRGVWNWMGIVSNMWMDREEDILTSDAHRKFVNAIDNGTYKEFFGKDAPDLWIWHVGVPVGYAKTVAYDERGFLVAAGEGHQGEFYDAIFDGLVKAEAKNPGAIGMSHGMPWDFLEIEKGDPLPGIRHNNIITGYMSDEFTFLPWEEAANLGTGLGGIMVKSMPLEIEERKRQWFIDTFGEDVVAQFDSRLSEIGKAADDAQIPKKEIANMEDSTDVQETVAEETLAEEVTEKPVEEQTVTEVESKADSEEQEDEDDDEDGEKDYVTKAELEEVVQEIALGVKEPFDTLMTEVKALRAELKELKKSEDERVTEKAESTPAASLSAIIARTIVGQEKAQLDYNKDRKLHQTGPEETEGSQGDGITGIPSIDALIKEQRGQRSVMAQATA